MRYLLLVVLLLSACESAPALPQISGPQEGEVYENKLTRERIQIDRVGVGFELKSHYLRSDSLVKAEMTDSTGKVMQSYFTAGFRTRPIYRGAGDSTAKSVAYLTDDRIKLSGGGWWIDGELHRYMPIKWANIKTAEEIETDYTLID
jgi:hypothetical protein